MPTRGKRPRLNARNYPSMLGSPRLRHLESGYAIFGGSFAALRRDSQLLSLFICFISFGGGGIGGILNLLSLSIYTVIYSINGASR